MAWTNCVGLSSSFEGFDVEVDRASQEICESVLLYYLNKFDTDEIQN